MSDPYDLERFVEAQNPVYEEVLAELRRGRKETHWMWFIFPQLRGLGHSWMSHKYGISSQAEAGAYLAHPILGPRLMACKRLVESHAGVPLESIFGPLDAMKFRSCMDLFFKRGTA